MIPKPTGSKSSQPPAERRMRLELVRSGRQEQPLRLLVYGTEGVGKSTFAAGSPKPIFLCGERGTDHLDVARFPAPESWQDVLDAVRTLLDEKHEYETVIIDTVDWIEPLLWDAVCQRGGKANIEDFGYGKGYVAALDEWRILLAQLERLSRDRRMHVILIAHSQIRTFKNPEGEDFDRYELKVHAKAGGMLKEWCDSVFFARYETFAVKDAGRAKGVSSGARVIQTERTAAWDAKNRQSLPEALPLSWTAFTAAVEATKHALLNPLELQLAVSTQIERLRATDPAKADQAKEYATKADLAALKTIHNRLAEILADGDKKGAVNV